MAVEDLFERLGFVVSASHLLNLWRFSVIGLGSFSFGLVLGIFVLKGCTALGLRGFGALSFRDPES